MLFKEIPNTLMNEQVIQKINNKEIKNQQDLVKAIKDTRNFITHADVKPKKSELILHNRELFIGNKILEMVMKYLIMIELGLDKEDIEKEIKNNSKFYVLYW